MNPYNNDDGKGISMEGRSKHVEKACAWHLLVWVTKESVKGTCWEGVRDLRGVGTEKRN
jgi:hypothetical protein